MLKLSVAVAVSVGGLAVFAPKLAQAHFMLNSPTNWWTQVAGDGAPQKTPPCGNETVANTMASKVVTTIQPGQTVPVTVQATIAHPGWYRISLKQGASSTQTTTSLPDPPTLGAAGSAQQCTPAFIDNPVWSPTQPVLADKLGIPSGSPTSTTTLQSGTKTFNVTIPSGATCTAATPCTLQVLMFMTDHAPPSCNYHHCADIAVATSTGTGGTGGSTGAGGNGGTSAGTGGRGGAAGSTAGSGGRGGTSGSAGMTGAAGNGAVAGTTGTSGTSGTSGTTGTGGTAVSGAAGTSGSAGTTGSAGAGGVTGSGGDTGTGGTTGSAGTGGEGSSGGCSVPFGHHSGLGIVLMMLLIAASRRRRERVPR
jgi:hypothetical protein